MARQYPCRTTASYHVTNAAETHRSLCRPPPHLRPNRITLRPLPRRKLLLDLSRNPLGHCLLARGALSQLGTDGVVLGAEFVKEVVLGAVEGALGLLAADGGGVRAAQLQTDRPDFSSIRQIYDWLAERRRTATKCSWELGRPARFPGPSPRAQPQSLPPEAHDDKNISR